MIGVDTNILVRAVLDDHPQESKLAKQLLTKISSEKNLFISSYAILEMAWVLKVKKCARKDIYESLISLVDSAGIVVGQREAILMALEMYIKGKADFGDYMLLAEGKLHNTHHLASFDKVLCKENQHTTHPSKCI